MKKKSFTLVEVVIAMVLMAILVGFLFNTHLETSLALQKLEAKKKVLAQQHRFYFRLRQICSSHPSITEDHQQLILRYQGGLDLDENFRGSLTSALYFQNKNIYLATWPEKENPRLELLWENADSFTFTLFPEKHPTLLKITVNDTEFPFFI